MIRSSFYRLALPVFSVALLVIPASSASAQNDIGGTAAVVVPVNSASAQTEYGRTAATGNWNDGEWIDIEGNTSATPGVTFADDVNIGGSTAVQGSIETATVDVTDAFELDTISVNSGTISILSGGSITADRLELTSANSNAIINGEFTSANSGIQSEGGSLTIGGTVSTFNTTLTGGELNFNSGSLFGRLTLNDNLGTAVEVNRAASGTTLDLDRLVVVGTTALTLNAGDSVNTSISLTSGATLTVNQQQDLVFGVSISGATLNLNENLNASSLFSDGTATINRGAGTINLQRLRLDENASFVVRADDVVTDSLEASDGSSITSDSELQLIGGGPAGVFANSGSIINLNAQTETGQVFVNGATVNVNAQTTVLGGTPVLDGTVDVLRDATLNINADLSSDDGTSVTSGGTLNLNTGGSLTGDLDVSKFGDGPDATTFNQNGGRLDLNDLSIRGTSSVVINSTDSLSGSFRIDNGAELTINKLLSLTGESEIGNATLNLNQDLVAEELLISGSSTVNRTNGARLDLGTLSIDQGSYTQDGFDTIRDGVNATNGSQFVIETESVFTGEIGVENNSELTINAATTLGVIDADSGSTVNVNADTVTGGTRICDSELNLNADLSASTLSLDGGSVLNQDSGTFTGRLRISDSFFSGTPIINRGDDTTLNLTSINIRGSTNLTIRETDQVTESIVLVDGADLTLAGNTNLSGTVFADASNVNLQADLVAERLRLGGEATLTRSNGAAFDVQDFTLVDTISGTGEYTYDGTDTIRRVIEIQQDGVLNIDASFGDVRPSQIVLSGGELNVNAETDVDFIDLSFFSETTINSDVTANLVNVEGGTLNLNGGVTSISTLNLGREFNSPIVNRNGGLLDIADLTVIGRISTPGGVNLELLDEDRVTNSIELDFDAKVTLSRQTALDSLTIGLASEFEFRLDEGESEGLSLSSLRIEPIGAGSLLGNGMGLLDIQFASLGEEGLNWGLRLDGNQTSRLQGFLSDDLVSFDLVGEAAADASFAPEIGIIRDIEAFGDFTYLGFVNPVAVPEPSSIMLLLVGCLGLGLRRSREMN